MQHHDTLHPIPLCRTRCDTQRAIPLRRRHVRMDQSQPIRRCQIRLRISVQVLRRKGVRRRETAEKVRVPLALREAMEERGREVHGAEDKERRAVKAIDFFQKVEQQTGDVRESVVLVSAA